MFYVYCIYTEKLKTIRTKATRKRSLKCVLNEILSNKSATESGNSDIGVFHEYGNTFNET